MTPQQEATKRYKILHKAELSEYAKSYYHENNNALLQRKLEKIECTVCRLQVARGNMLRHNRSKKHLDNMKIKEEEHSKEIIYNKRLECFEYSIQQLRDNEGVVSAMTDDLRLYKMNEISRSILVFHITRVLRSHDKNEVSLELVQRSQRLFNYVEHTDFEAIIEGRD
jgi:hypothetical protein